MLLPLTSRAAAVLVAAGLLAACTGAPPGGGGAATPTGSPSRPGSTPGSPLPNPVTELNQVAEPAMPAAVQEVGAAASGSDLFVVGGYNAAGASTSGFYLFNGRSWTAGPSLPEAVNHPAAAVVGAALVVAGGFTATGATNRVFALPAGAKSWQAVPPMKRARGALTLLTVAGKLYAIGGLNGSSEVAIPEVFNPNTQAWTDLPPMPHPRDHGAGYVDGNLACVAGGREPATSVAIDCFDTTTSTWQVEASLPTATSGAAAALLGTVIVVAGGEPVPETKLVPIVQELHRGTWTSEPMLVPRHGTGNAVFGGRLWMCGGATAAGVHPTTACTSIGM